MEVTILIILFIGVGVGRILGVIVFELIDDFSHWYGNKYGKFTPGDGRNYMQIFHRGMEIKR